MTDIQFTDFYTKGFQVFDGTKYSQQIDISNVNWEYEGGVGNDYHPSNNLDFLNFSLCTVHYQIALDIVESNVKEYTIDKRRIWEGVNPNAAEWHNDLREGPNCFFLLYHSNMLSDGLIHFRTNGQEWSLVPVNGLLVSVNCDLKFEHRAEPSKKQRVISAYCFNLKGLNNG